jgi:hypothetical protein
VPTCQRPVEARAYPDGALDGVRGWHRGSAGNIDRRREKRYLCASPAPRTPAHPAPMDSAVRTRAETR